MQTLVHILYAFGLPMLIALAIGFTLIYMTRGERKAGALVSPVLPSLTLHERPLREHPLYREYLRRYEGIEVEGVPLFPLMLRGGQRNPMHGITKYIG